MKAVLKIFNLLFIALCGVTTTYAQTYKSTSWSANFYLGASNMMGDLGGSNFIGSRGIFDLDLTNF